MRNESTRNEALSGEPQSQREEERTTESTREGARKIARNKK